MRGYLDRVLGWARHARAPWIRGAVSFAESSFFLIPPDAMLVPMALARPQRALRLAAWTTLAVVAGGVVGYAIGALALERVRPLLLELGYAEAFALVQRWFADHGFAAALVSGFSPIPYKVFCLAAASMGMFLPPPSSQRRLRAEARASSSSRGSWPGEGNGRRKRSDATAGSQAWGRPCSSWRCT